MKIWLINHYAVPPQYYPLARPTLFAKYLKKLGHEVIIFAASSVHNSDINLIEDKSLYKKETVDGVHYVYIKCAAYQRNDVKRVINILQFAQRLPFVCRYFKKPDAIVSTSFDPISCYQGISLAKKYHAKAIAEIADLWPETPVAYGLMRENSPIVKGLRNLEKKIYNDSDAIIFTMEGAYDYIKEQGWGRDIPRTKVFYINNGVDLEEFDSNLSNYIIKDEDLEDEDIFKVVYTGAIRTVNHVSGILDVAKKITDSQIKFLVWGDGDEVEIIEKRIKNENINNFVLKGKVEKKYIPYILSKADVCLMHGQTSGISKYGMSLNKSFEYLASGKPIITTINGKYNYITNNRAGYYVRSDDVENYANVVLKVKNMKPDNYQKLCKNSRKAAEQYDFKNLTKKLEKIIEGIEARNWK